MAERLIRLLATLLLALPLPGERLLGTSLVARLHVEGVLLDLLDDVFLLDLALEAPESALNRLVVGNLDLGQPVAPPSVARLLKRGRSGQTSFRLPGVRTKRTRWRL